MSGKYTTWKPGMGVQTISEIYKLSQNVKFLNPAKLAMSSVRKGTLGRIASESGGTFLLWLYEDMYGERLEIEVPRHMMGTLFELHKHGIYPDLGS